MPEGERKIVIAVDLSTESAHAIKWAVSQYLRAGDTVTVLHVQPTSVLYGADWGPATEHDPVDQGEAVQQKADEDMDSLTMVKSTDIAKPLQDAGIPFRIHIVKDHDMKERICLEVERLGADIVIMGSRGFGAQRRARRARLGSVSDYCVHHCDCPVVVVRLPEDKRGGLSLQQDMSSSVAVA